MEHVKQGRKSYRCSRFPVKMGQGKRCRWYFSGRAKNLITKRLREKSYSCCINEQQGWSNSFCSVAFILQLFHNANCRQISEVRLRSPLHWATTRAIPFKLYRSEQIWLGFFPLAEWGGGGVMVAALGTGQVIIKLGKSHSKISGGILCFMGGF